MRLTIFNGSPRVKKSNSRILARNFRNGFDELPGNSSELFYLYTRDKEANFEAFKNAEAVVIVFPVYWNAMPSDVMEFIESLAPLKNSNPHLKLGFIIHSAFPEANHSRFVEKYLEKLTVRLGCKYLGTIVKPGSEGVRIMPSFMTMKLFSRLHDLGKMFAETGEFDNDICAKLAKPEMLGPFSKAFVGLLAKMGITNSYWDSALKRYNVFEDRFATPYLDEE